MKSRHLLFALLLVVIVSLFAACACAAEIRPIPVDHDKVDLGSGHFDLLVRNTVLSEKHNWFIATLYREDRYSAEQIKALAVGDTVWMNDTPFIVSEVVVHGDPDNPDDPPAYEIYPADEFDGYLVFTPCSDGTFRAVINDWAALVLLGSVKVSLPLPDSFEYVSISAGMENEPLNAQDFISGLEDNTIAFNPYNTSCVFANGELVEITESSYPWGPDAEFDRYPVPVWKFCHGLRDGLDTAVITAYRDEETLIPLELTPEEAGSIRDLAINGVITEKASDESVTGNTWIYSFETPGGKHLLSFEMYKGHIVGSDGMYDYQ